MNTDSIDELISKLPPVLFEIPNDEDYAKTLAGQIRAIPITQDTRKAIKQLIQTVEVEARIRELEMLPIMRNGLHTPQKELDIILVDTVRQRIATLQSKDRKGDE